MGINNVAGGRDSDSFVAVAEVDELLTSLGMPEVLSTWQSLSLEEKEIRLRLSAQMMSFFSLRGKRSYRGQALAFPRTGISAKLPRAVKQAQVWLACVTVHKALVGVIASTDDASGTGDIKSVDFGGLLSVTLGNVSTAGKGLLAKLTSAENFMVSTLLQPYLATFSGGSVLNEDEITISLSSTTTTYSTTTGSTSSSTTTSTGSTTTS